MRAHLGVERMNLLGFSHGGIVAMVYAASYPERVDRLVLASTIAVFDEAAQAAQAAGIEASRGEPWFAAAERAIADEQAGEFATAEDLAANVTQQMPLYFHRWEGHEETGRELAADFAQAEPLQHFNEHEFPTFDLRPDLRTIGAPTLVVDRRVGLHLRAGLRPHDRRRAARRTPRPDPGGRPLHLHRAARRVPQRARRVPRLSVA